MNDDSDNTVVRGCSELIVGFGLGMLACLLISLCSCKSGYEVIRQEVPVVVTQEKHTESVKVDVVRDTITQRDSVYHYIKGDTTIIERWHYYTNNNNAIKVDTLIKVDSIPYQVTTEKVTTQIKEVNVLRWWQKVLIAIGGIALIVAGLFTAYRLGKRIV